MVNLLKETNKKYYLLVKQQSDILIRAKLCIDKNTRVFNKVWLTYIFHYNVIQFHIQFPYQNECVE